MLRLAFGVDENAGVVDGAGSQISLHIADDSRLSGQTGGSEHRF